MSAPDQAETILPADLLADLRAALVRARDAELTGEIVLRLRLHKGVVKAGSVVPDLPVEFKT